MTSFLLKRKKNRKMNLIFCYYVDRDE
uniref:Uncharacterized protein n=1 Tax=Anguilla anguilla TaxID=7936 RepID=A0A0E9TB03_ANGAN